MQFKSAYRLFALMAVLMGSQAQAAYDVYVYQEGPDVVAHGSGTIDLSALTPLADGHTEAFIQSLPAALAIGSSDLTGTAYEGRLTGPLELGSNMDTHPAAVSGGDLVAIAGVLHRVVVPHGYISGTPLASSAQWSSQTIDNLGFTPGTYSWNWGTGQTQDSFTLHVGMPPPPAALAMGK